MAVRIKGLSQLNRRLKKEFNEIALNKLVPGIRAAVVFAQGEAQELTPRDTGFLINSAFNDVTKTSTEVRGVVGFTAEYAVKVHEMPASTNWQKEGAENKFLEKAINRNTRQITDIIAKRAKI